MKEERGRGVNRRFSMKRLIQFLTALLLTPILILGGRPFAMTSNTREDNPVWNQLPEFNRYQARLTYAMSRGRPKVEVAWLLADAEWPDRPAIGEGKTLNAGESSLSRALVGAGIGYHRISRNDLLHARVEEGRLLVGEADFGALLVDDLGVAEPELLQQVLRIRRSGLPVVWQGELRIWLARLRQPRQGRVKSVGTTGAGGVAG
jgi:hypothetical protein